MLISRPLPPDIDLLALHRLGPGRYPLLLESVAHGTAQARWDLLLAACGDALTLGRDGLTRDATGAGVAGHFLDALDAAWRAARYRRSTTRRPTACAPDLTTPHLGLGQLAPPAGYAGLRPMKSTLVIAS